MNNARKASHKVNIILLLFTLLTNLASSGAVNCDTSWYAQPVTTSGGTTIFDVTTAITIGYLDTPFTKGPFFIRGTNGMIFANCANPSYSVAISPATCQNLLYWDSGATQPCSTAKTTTDTTSIQLTAKVTNSA